MPAARSAAPAEPVPTSFGTAEAFHAWLEANHASSGGLWLKIAKRAAGEPGITYAEAVEAALCWGWIDGRKAGLDERHFLQRFTPRRPRSVWSKANVDRVAALIESGRMQAAGLAQVEAARGDGRWAHAYGGGSTATVPDDLAAALDADPPARAFFDSLDARNRYAVLWRVQTAAEPQTRARRIARLVGMLARGEPVHRSKP